MYDSGKGKQFKGNKIRHLKIKKITNLKDWKILNIQELHLMKITITKQTCKERIKNANKTFYATNIF